jgi:SAM-dependent methyltransferase
MENRIINLEERGGNLRFLQAVLAHISLTNGSKVLEIGCGTGVLGEFVGAVTGATVYGTERSARLALLASRRIRCIYYPDGSLPVLVGPFDLIYCKDMLMMVDDKRAFFRSVRSRLFSGGAFCTYLPDEADYDAKHLFKFIRCGKEESRRRYGTITDNLALLEECGFKDVKTVRLFLGTVQMNENYVRRHWDGYFSNSDSAVYEGERFAGLSTLWECIDHLEAFGILAHYEWERTMVIAR